jgi:hypothetical protein
MLTSAGCLHWQLLSQTYVRPSSAAAASLPGGFSGSSESLQAERVSQAPVGSALVQWLVRRDAGVRLRRDAGL